MSGGVDVLGDPFQLSLGGHPEDLGVKILDAGEVRVQRTHADAGGLSDVSCSGAVELGTLDDLTGPCQHMLTALAESGEFSLGLPIGHRTPY